MEDALLSSKSHDWNTPENVLERIRAVDSIGLDPCSNASSIVNARASYSLERGENGLEHDWYRQGLVFVNPPYGKELREQWADQIAGFGAFVRTRATDSLIALVPARPDTGWFRAMREYARLVYFWRSRITFINAPTAAPFPSALFYYGEHSGRFFEAFRDQGGWFAG